MDNPKKVLIVYASAGHGHEKAAQAVAEAFHNNAPGVNAVLLDTVRLANGLNGALYKHIYLLQIKYVPWLWGFFYYTFDVPLVYFFVRFARRILNAYTLRDFHKTLTRENPDAIVATHFQAVEIAGRLKKKGVIRSRILSVVTDYLPHHVWTDPQVDLYCVAAEETRTALLKIGVASEKIRVTGIPVHHKFGARRDKTAARARLGLDEHAFTALVTSGGVGLNAIREMTEHLSNELPGIQLLVVCGTNRALFSALDPLREKKPLLKVYGFVSNMDELMDAADVLVGKAGGITISEAFAKGLPMLLFRSVPGQEGKNTRFVCQKGAGLRVGSGELLAKTLTLWTGDPATMKPYQDAVEALAKPDAAGCVMREALK